MAAVVTEPGASAADSSPDFQSLFESAPGLYVVLKPDFTIVAASDAYLHATKAQRGDILGRGIFEAFPDNPDDPAATGVRNLKASLERVRESGTADTMAVQKYDIRRPEAEGGGFEERYWSPVNSPVLTKGTRELAYIIHRVEDVTEFIRLKQHGVEQNRVTEELKTRTEQMEGEIFLRAQQLQEANRHLREANQRLDQLDQTKTQFFANVSHELRTPLALIIGLTDKLINTPERSPEDRRDLAIVARNARALRGHVNDLLDVSKLAAGEMRVDYADLNLGDLVRLAAGQFDVIAREHGIAYALDIPETVRGQADPEKLQRILLNLLSNAFKFTPDGGAVRCSLRAQGSHAILQVADSGPGVPRDQRSVVFERFHQLDWGDTRRVGGTGLGLAIARDFAELHRGSIEIEDAPEGGALFIVQIPLQAPAGAPLRSEPWLAVGWPDDLSPDSRLNDTTPVVTGAAGQDCPLVLVIEDNREMNRFICHGLGSEFRTLSAFDGREGLRQALLVKPDVILTDVMMPELGGEAVVRAVREHQELDLTPIVLLTAKADEGLRVRLLRQGAQDYLTKPFPTEELVVRIRNLASIKRSREKVLQAEERFRALMDSAPDAMVVVDEQGRIALVNARTETLFGYAREELLGKTIEILIPERFRTGHSGHRGVYLHAPATRSMGSNLDLYARRRDGSEVPVEVSLSPVASSAGLRVASAIRDVSDRKRVLEQLREARNEADRANRGKSTFLATASHDLRQPLQTLSLLNGALIRMVKDPDPAEALAQQEAAIGVMSRLLNALLDISKLESGAVEPVYSTWQGISLLDQLRSEFLGIAAEKGLEFEVKSSEAWVHSDLSLVGQVLRNLVSNAIKYTKRGRVSLRCRQDRGLVHVEVADTGIGMDPQELAHIYREFYQIGVPTNAAREGYGLGLSIVSRIVKLLDLKLDVHSELGKGSTFSLALPAGAPVVSQDGLQGAAEIRKDTKSAHHILVVEDEPAVLNATRLLLKAEGYRVATATTVAEAVGRIRESSDLELLLTDYHLAGGETGKQVISLVRAIRGADFKTIMITGDTSSAARGPDGDESLYLLSKPVDPAALLKLLGKLLEPARK
jgi:PAS domain S-box-containing protein